MKKKLIIALATTSLLVGFVGLSNALLIDFTSNTWKDIGSLSSATRTIDGIDVTVKADGGNLTWNPEHGEIDLAPSGLVGIGDGIGVKNDEISLGQILTVSFSPDVIVKEIYLLDLFSSEPELAAYRLQGDNWMTNIGGSGLPFGFKSISTSNSATISWIEFATFDDTYTSDYAVAGMLVTTAPVPEPATMLLFGTGLVGLAGARLRKNKK